MALPKFSDTKVLVLISSIVTCKATSNDNMLRVELGLSIHVERIIQHLFEHEITSSYGEECRFKLSAALAKTNKSSELNLDSTACLIKRI